MATMARDLGRAAANAAAGVPSPATAELAAAAQRAQTFAGGSGAAVLSVETGELVCRAISGTSPAVGTRFPLTASFPGLCVKERRPLKCDEADTDARVEKGAYVALKIKSIVVVPIMQQQNAVGVLAVFSSSAGAFHNTHIAILRTMADSTLGALRTVRQETAGAAAPTEAVVPESPAQQIPVTAAVAPVSTSPAAQAPTAVPPRPPSPPPMPADGPSPLPAAAMPVVARPEAPKRPPDLVLQPVGEPVSPSPQSFAKKEEIVSLAADVGPRPTIKQHTTVRPPTPRVRPAMARPTSTLSRRYSPRQQKKGVPAFVLVAIVIVAIGVGGWVMHSRRSAPVAEQASAPSTPSEQQAVAAASTQSAPAAEPVEAADAQQPASSTIVREAATTEVQPGIVPASVAVAKPAPPSKPATQPPRRSRKEVAGVRAEHKPAAHPATVAAPATAQADSPSVKPAVPVPNPPPVDGSPKVALLPNTVPVPGLVKSAPATLPTLTQPKPPEATPAEIIKRVPPRYPALALSSHLTGTVMVTATVSKEGRVTAVQVVSGPPLFREAATTAVKQWRFKPATINGVATESTANIELRFTNAER